MVTVQDRPDTETDTLVREPTVEPRITRPPTARRTVLWTVVGVVVVVALGVGLWLLLRPTEETLEPALPPVAVVPATPDTLYDSGITRAVHERTAAQHDAAIERAVQEHAAQTATVTDSGITQALREQPLTVFDSGITRAVDERIAAQHDAVIETTVVERDGD